MKKRGAAAGRARRGGEKLNRLRLAVEEFVKAAGDQPPLPASVGSERPNRKSRRELRKEKRRLKRSRRRLQQHGETGKAPAAPARPAPAASPKVPASPPAAVKQRPEPPRQQKAVRPPVPAPRPAAISWSRKRALLEANEEEEKEIRRLERRLGLNKRRKKKGNSGAEGLPQSFVRDGLDYVLGVLGSGAGLGELCGDSDQEEAPGLRASKEAPEEDDEEEEEEEALGEDEELEDASDASEGEDVEEQWESDGSSAPEGEPEASEPPDPQEEEEVGCLSEIAQTCFPKRHECKIDFTSTLQSVCSLTSMWNVGENSAGPTKR